MEDCKLYWENVIKYVHFPKDTIHEVIEVFDDTDLLLNARLNAVQSNPLSHVCFGLACKIENLSGCWHPQKLDSAKEIASQIRQQLRNRRCSYAQCSLLKNNQQGYVEMKLHMWFK